MLVENKRFQDSYARESNISANVVVDPQASLVAPASIFYYEVIL